jgi:hypothetical protein
MAVFEDHLSGKPYCIADTIVVSDVLGNVQATPRLIDEETVDGAPVEEDCD